MNLQHDDLDPVQRTALRALLVDHARRDGEKVPARAHRHRIVGITVGIGSLTAVTAGALVIAFGGVVVAPAPAGPPPSVPAVTSTVIGGLDVQQAGGTTLFADTSNVQMQALVTGTIRLQSGCFVVQGVGSAAAPLVFPKGTRLSPDGRSAEVPGLGVVADGDAISGGGGVGQASGMSGPCATDGDVVRWQSTGAAPADPSTPPTDVAVEREGTLTAQIAYDVCAAAADPWDAVVSTPQGDLPAAPTLSKASIDESSVEEYVEGVWTVVVPVVRDRAEGPQDGVKVCTIRGSADDPDVSVTDSLD